ncbi:MULTISPECIES: serine/threonine-protein kinase [Microbacterium]|uniref:serine/threonine-protein kinase n=1 Tax=Microbacterium TaxID=33882 RepID=UPI0012C90C94|nr:MULTISPECIES: serine/threonine-protein kinase [Microbacterium]MPT14017.1 serine/threonine protein kinase [Microbacterium sp.]
MITQEAPPTAALLDGRYRLAEAVGMGGMATVYRAEDIALERTVAVKMFRESDDAIVSVERVHSEKALLAGLNHPGLVTLLDAHLEPGRPKYLVMEYVPGPTLSKRMARATVTPREIATIGADIASALHAVHSAGIVHRDIKPSNVLLTPPLDTNGRWSAKLADFGIACAIDMSRVTTPGIVLGTLTYMAPEQLRNGDIRPAVDIYALGLVLLEALTGKPGFAPTLSVESALTRLHIAPEIPAELGSEWAALLSAMTAIDPDARPHALEVESELRRLIDLPVTEEVATDVTVPLPAPTASTVPRTRAEARARRRAASAHPAASPARRTRRRRESLLIAAVVMLGAVTTGSAALLGHGEQALASSGAVSDGASRIVEGVEDLVPVEPAPADTLVDSEPTETVAVEPVAATPVAPTASVTESVAEESLPENAAPQAQENRGKSPGRDGNNGKGKSAGNSGKGNSSH